MARAGRRTRIALAAAFLLGAPAAAFAAGPQVGVIPEPLSVAPAAGEAPVTVAQGAAIFVSPGDASSLYVAHKLSEARPHPRRGEG
jgi:hypothetical protein